MTGWRVPSSNSVLLAPSQTADISGELNDSALQPQTQTQKGDAVFASILDCDDFPLNPAVAETAGDDNPVNAVKKQRGSFVVQLFGINPSDADANLMGKSTVLEGFNYTQVSVAELDIFAHHRYVHFADRIATSPDKFAPVRSNRVHRRSTRAFASPT
jgi:hypothetical protein